MSRRGRPKIHETPPQYPTVVVRLTPEEKALIVQAAKIDERATSIWAKRTLLEAAKRLVAGEKSE